MSKKKLRAVGYCRTSSEGQRDNTSIPVQQDGIKAFCDTNNWSLAKCYVDESKSGSKIEGREDFQQMLKDAANDQFDIIVVYSVTRFARDSVDILQTAKLLKMNYGVSVVSTSHDLDTRNIDNALMNTVQAGVAEHERLSILKRTQYGRVARAKEGKPWGQPPVGRQFDKATGKWSISDQGRMIATIFQRYVDGESWNELRKEKGIKGSNRISQWVNSGQLSGVYEAHFDCPAIGLDERVPVPQIPEIIPQHLLEKVKARLSHNRTYNRHDCRSYVLTGFIRCEDCGKALSGQTESGIVRYRHKGQDSCSTNSVNGDLVETAILDYLYNAFLDEPNYNKAVDRALPSTEHRQKLIKELDQTEKLSAKNSKAIDNLIDAIAEGVDPVLMIGKQDQLKAEQGAVSDRLEAIQMELATMPSAEQTKAAAMFTRIHLIQEHRGKDWRELPYEEIKRFLFHLFGESKIKTGNGIFVRLDEKDRIVATFKGQMEFDHKVVDGRPTSNLMKDWAEMYNTEIRQEFDKEMKKIEDEKQAALNDLKPCLPIVTACVLPVSSESEFSPLV